MAANLAGFVVGAAGLKPLLADMLAQPTFVAATFAVFFSAAQVRALTRYSIEHILKKVSELLIFHL